MPRAVIDFVPPPWPYDAPPWLMAETWEEGTTRVALLVGGGVTQVRAYLLANDTARREWSGLATWLDRFPDPRDIRAFVAGLPRTPARASDLEAIGLVDGKRSLPERLLRAMRATFLGETDRADDPFGLDFDDDFDFGSFGMDQVDDVDVDPLVPEPDAPVPAFSTSSDGMRVPRLRETETNEGPLPCVMRFAGRKDRQVEAAVKAAVARAAAFLAGPEDLAAFALLGRGRWRPGIHAALADPGEAGLRWRRAATVQPALFTAAYGSTEARGLVEGGRPFEAALGRALESLTRGRGAPSMAAMRRLRSLPPGDSMDVVRRAVELSASLPVDWLPADAAGWARLGELTARVMDPAARAGIEPADLVRRFGGDWVEAIADLRADGGEEGRANQTPARLAGRAVEGASDVAARMATTLVEPVLAWVGVEHRRTRQIAGRVLFAGRSLTAVDRVQRRWHVDMRRMEAQLRASMDNAWPEAFPAFAAPGGYTVACIVDERGLVAEGTDGPDEDGLPGLAHCVGTYGERCHAGECVIASVRRADGSRASTVQLVLSASGKGEGQGADGGLSLRTAQHYGHRNGEPETAARAAVVALRQALADGSHPHDMAAFRGRPGSIYRRNDCWDTPEALERSYRAWRTYLPREVAKGGLPALRERVLAVAAAVPDTWPADGAAPADPFGRMVEALDDGFGLEDPFDLGDGLRAAHRQDRDVAGILARLDGEDEPFGIEEPFDDL